MPHWCGMSLDTMRPLVRIVSTISSSLVVPKMVWSSCLLGRARMPCEPWPVWKTSNESTIWTSGIELCVCVDDVKVWGQRSAREKLPGPASEMEG